MTDDKKVGEARAGFEAAKDTARPGFGGYEKLWPIDSEVAAALRGVKLKEAEAAALKALRAWREADRELFAAKAALAELDGLDWTAGGTIWAARKRVEQLKAVEQEKRALAMVAADALPPVEEVGSGA